MFDKVVTPSDVGKLNRLVIPKQHAERFFPLEPAFADKGLVLSFEDGAGKQWCFRYSYWSSSQSYVITKGWCRFVKEKQLDAGDIVSFFRARSGEDGQRRRLFIDLQRRHRPRPVGHQGVLIASTAPPMRWSWPPHFYHGSVVPPQHVAVQVAAGGGDMGSMPTVLDPVPVVLAAAEPKRVRLFGVNLDCPETEGSKNSPLLPPCQWRTESDESADISTKRRQPSMYPHFGCSDREDGRR
ncbi:hypothetical protein BHE74_00015956 [Ensete ventricosum]|nr:hypothetical protein BHE74_00015956 [Ensete ventricosum]RZR88171.1 hypothetical protein BHM03_00015683 [Ensete ventricosum]